GRRFIICLRHPNVCGLSNPGLGWPLACAKATPRKEKAMSYRIAISFAAAAIGISCIATDASAKGGGGGGGGRSSGGTGKNYRPGGVFPTLRPRRGGAAGGARDSRPPPHYRQATPLRP